MWDGAWSSAALRIDGSSTCGCCREGARDAQTATTLLTGNAAVQGMQQCWHEWRSDTSIQLAIPCQKTSKGAAWLRSNLLQDGNSFCALRAPAGVSPGSMQQPSRSRLVQADAAPLVLTTPVRPLRRCTRSTLLQGTPGLDNSAAP